MRDKLWINRWTERRKESAVSNAKQGISFLGGYNMTDYKNVLFELWVGLNMYKGSPTSCYSNIIPPNGSEVIKVRLSDHRSTENEWGQNELTGYPNRRYSIVIFSMKSMPDESKQDIVETEWQSYLSNGIPVYEKCFNRFYLKDTFPKLISILQDIYSGGAPEDNTIRVDLTENKQHKTRYNMKKTIRLSESDLHRLIKESVKRCLKETQKDLGNDEWNGHRTKVQEIFDKINDASLCLKNYLQTCDTKWDNMGALGECATHLYQAAHALESLHMALDTHREPTDQYLGYDY